MWVHCVEVPEDTPDVQVVVFGTEGKSSSQKVQNLNDNPFLVGFFFLSCKFYRSVTVKEDLQLLNVKFHVLIFFVC